ncbi:hypothetical protein DVR12_01725 [Chitinophaga silvatica]|uniref:Lipoprotein n=1 Tax=Chitinophaga silvatica TaxID=2282649 RepID=A0A3E1YGN6_9BACT|nr:hypothetical protein [Chitinophaga silvatica]RFS26532.1 hypothetical protein DVR12_01725 [Chitinophaga silvatica]
MKRLYPIILSATLFACAEPNNPTFGQKPVAKEANTKALHPAIWPLNDTLQVLYFKEKIHNINVEMYLKSEISTIDSTRHPENDTQLLDLFNQEENVVFINNKKIPLKFKIGDSQIMLPESIEFLTHKQKNYILIKLSLVSFMPYVGYDNIAFEIKNNNVVRQLYVQTKDELNHQTTINWLDKQSL